MDQVSRFSRDRFRKAIRSSQRLRPFINREALPDEDEGPAISRIAFSNGSLCYMVSAWGDFDAIRNIPADIACIDEAQDVQGEAIPVVEEALSHSTVNRLVLVGTASDQGDSFDQLWQQSDMKEWDKRAKAWVPQKAANQFYSGYHFSQEMAPWILRLPPGHPNSIDNKRVRYHPRRFSNEVLGLFFRGLAKPLIPTDVLACADRSAHFLKELVPPAFSFGGFDWGGGVNAFSVEWFMTKTKDQPFRLIYARKFEEPDMMKVADVMAGDIERFNMKQGVADIGYGIVPLAKLQQKFGSRILGCQYVRRPEIPLERKEFKVEGQIRKQMIINADRTFWIENGLDLMKRRAPNGQLAPMLQLPWAEPLEIEWIVDHFTCLEMEAEESVSGRKYHVYTHPDGQPDDAYHGYIYCLIAEALSRTEFKAGAAMMDW